MKIYTGTGDGGETGLFGGRRVGKDDPRVAAGGDLDELNALLGWAASLLAPADPAGGLEEIQRDLFALGADLADPPGPGEAAEGRTVRLGAGRVRRLEELIDRYEEENEPLSRFVLPGGAPGAAALQVCRAVCRRAERAVVALSRREPVAGEALAYLNRLSDLLFVLARWVNGREEAEQPTWDGGTGEAGPGG